MPTPANKGYPLKRTHLTLRRLPNNPIIRPDMLAGNDGANINGPSLISTPDWIPERLGNYYLYFAHHAGRYIRLAYSDRLEGSWSVYKPGTLHLKDVSSCRDHIASPDVHVDDFRREIRMYFHGASPNSKIQLSYVAVSTDGLTFKALEAPLGNFYMRVIKWRDSWIGMAKGGVLYWSNSGPFRFEQLHSAFPMSDEYANRSGDVRHVALNCFDDTLEVYFSRIGDRPEHILRAHIDLSLPRNRWRATNVESVLFPKEEWEGGNLPRAPSKAGASLARENALRDPAVFMHQERFYLLYSVAGESGIGIAELE